MQPENIQINTKAFPNPIKLRHLLGPSFIILALGLGSGEVILWPFLSANYGLGIAWGALLGITFQYFINLEIERYALIKGESVFVGISEVFRYAPYWLILSTFLGFGLPGIMSASSTLFGHIFGIEYYVNLITIFLLIFAGSLLSVGKSVYKTMETITKIILAVGIPFIIGLTIYLANWSDFQAGLNGLVGIGDGYNWLPEGIVLATFLAAFAYSGAGGNLNLTQSVYIKEKGYGMGKYSKGLASIFNSKEEKNIKLKGESFDYANTTNKQNFDKWFKQISLEHLLIFWFLGFLAMFMLMILAYTTAYGGVNSQQGISFVITQGVYIAQQTFPLLGSIFLLVLGIMLFQTHLGILDSASRLMSENLAITKLKKQDSKTLSGNINLSKIYFGFIWGQIIFGIILILFGVAEPKSLIVLGAVMNAVSMFIHIGLVNWTNYKLLPKEYQPKLWRRIILLFIFIIFGGFSLFVIGDNLIKLI